MEVVLVGVRHQHRVDGRDLEIRRLAPATDRPDATDEEWIEQELRVAEL
jgi:hypothetical protein